MNLLEAEMKLELLRDQFALLRDSIVRQFVSNEPSVESFSEYIKQSNELHEKKIKLLTMIDVARTSSMVDGSLVAEMQHRVVEAKKKQQWFRHIHEEASTYLRNEHSSPVAEELLRTIEVYLDKSRRDILHAETELLELSFQIEVKEPNVRSTTAKQN